MAESHVVLYHHARSCSTVPLAVFHELHVPVEVVPMGFDANHRRQAADGSITADEYLKIHPLGYVAALTVDGTVITEGLAICTYAAERAPERHLLGANPFERGKVYEWVAWLTGTVHGYGFGGLWRPLRFVDDHEEMHPAIVEKAKKTIHRSYGVIEKEIGDDFAVLGKLTVADFYLYIMYRWGEERAGWDMKTSYPRYTALVNRIKARDSIKQAIQFENDSQKK